MRFRSALLLSLPALVLSGQMSPSDQALVGDWQAAIQSGPSIIHLAVHIQRSPDGKTWTGTLDSPDQNALGLPLGNVLQDGAKVSFTLPLAGARFEGLLDLAATKIEGTWTQGIGTPLTFTRNAAAPAAKPIPPSRPQEPHAPFPYDQEEVTFPGGAKDVSLAGTLTHPKGKGPFPAVILIHGSGPHGRDEVVFGHRPFLVLADHLTRKGFAVLRYDKRGIGKSTGSYATATSLDFAADAEGALAFLRTRPEVDRKKLGLMGHSEGGVIAPIAATHDASATFLVLLAGPSLPGEAIILAQTGLIAKAAGAPPEAIEADRKLQERTFAIVKAHPEGAARQLREILAEAQPGQDEASLAAKIQVVDSAWMRTFLTLDPRPHLAQVKVPVLALYGEKDLQVPPVLNRLPMVEALRKAGNPRSETRILPGLNHLFQPATTGGPQEYGAIPTTFDPGTLEAITAWIQAL